LTVALGGHTPLRRLLSLRARRALRSSRIQRSLRSPRPGSLPSPPRTPSGLRRSGFRPATPCLRSMIRRLSHPEPESALGTTPPPFKLPYSGDHRGRASGLGDRPSADPGCPGPASAGSQSTGGSWGPFESACEVVKFDPPTKRPSSRCGIFSAVSYITKNGHCSVWMSNTIRRKIPIEQTEILIRWQENRLSMFLYWRP
jgi:hypothetical protein